MYEFKSKEELYFSYYLEELKDNGFVHSWYYETTSFTLTPKVTRTYKKQMKTKVKDVEEFLLHPSSITADFTVIWNNKAVNIFISDPEIPVKDINLIPFRVSYHKRVVKYISLVDVKTIRTFRANTSDISFPYKQKFAFMIHSAYIQKIKPFHLHEKPSSLFVETFTPKKVVDSEKYVKNSLHGKKGDSKLKYTPRSLTEFLLKIKNN